MRDLPSVHFHRQGAHPGSPVRADDPTAIPTRIHDRRQFDSDSGNDNRRIVRSDAQGSGSGARTGERSRARPSTSLPCAATAAHASEGSSMRRALLCCALFAVVAGACSSSSASSAPNNVPFNGAPAASYAAAAPQPAQWLQAQGNPWQTVYPWQTPQAPPTERSQQDTYRSEEHTSA